MFGKLYEATSKALTEKTFSSDGFLFGGNGQYEFHSGVTTEPEALKVLSERPLDNFSHVPTKLAKSSKSFEEFVDKMGDYEWTDLGAVYGNFAKSLEDAKSAFEAEWDGLAHQFKFVKKGESYPSEVEAVNESASDGLNLVDQEAMREQVKNDGLLLRYVTAQDEAVIKEAVKNNGMALEYAKIQTPEICLLAVKQTPCALYYVQKMTDEILKAATDLYPGCQKYIRTEVEVQK